MSKVLNPTSQIYFYPSVSSVSKNILTPIQHIEILISINHNKFLISAYDLFHAEDEHHEKLKGLFFKAKEQEQIIMMDSGIYEKTWRIDTSWKREDYNKICEKYNFNYTFNYDEYNRNDSKEMIIKTIIQNLERNNKCPIIHSSNPEDLPEICFEISKTLTPDLIAIPERELGNGIYEGLKTMNNIRKRLNELSNYQRIHILGTGNPLSILAYCLMGADSFDGLDWCQTVADYETATLHHTQHYSFYAHQSQFGQFDDMDFFIKLFAHNLYFYEEFLNKINESVRENSLENLAQKYLPNNAYSVIQKLL